MQVYDEKKSVKEAIERSYIQEFRAARRKELIFTSMLVGICGMSAFLCFILATILI